MSTTNKATKNKAMNGARAGILLIALLASAHAASYLGAGPCDDDFIVYRYARNFIAGDGLVFNTGERFEGFTVPLWVFVHAAGLALRLDPVKLSLCLSIASCGVATYAVGEAWRRRYAGVRFPVPALLLAATPAFAWHGVAGLGTTCLAALLALTVLFHEEAERRNRTPLAAALCLAAACLLRQECALFALPFSYYVLRKRGSFLAASLPLVSLGAWTIFRLAYYGRWLPITYGVKKLPMTTDLVYGGRYLWLSTLECGVGLLLILAWIGVGRLRKQGGDEPAGNGQALARLYVFCLTLHTLYVVWVGGDYMPLARFFIPTLPLLLYWGCIPLWGCAPFMALRPASPLLRPALCVLALLALQWRQLERHQLFEDHIVQEQYWSRLGQHFSSILPPDTSVAISPIGAFGWYSELPIVDILGLVHDGTLDAEPELEGVSMKGHHRFDPEYVFAAHPDYLILGNGVLLLTGKINPWEWDLHQDPRVEADYSSIRMSIPGAPDLYLHKRRDLADPPGVRR